MHFFKSYTLSRKVFSAPWSVSSQNFLHGHAECRETWSRIIDQHLRIKVMVLWSFPMFVCGSHVFAMFPAHFTWVCVIWKTRPVGPCASRVWPWLFCVVSRHGMRPPASAYLRTVSKCVAGFVYTEGGKSNKDTVNSIQHTHTHTHTHTYTHNNTCAQMHTHNGRHVRRVCGRSTNIAKPSS